MNLISDSNPIKESNGIGNCRLCGTYGQVFDFIAQELQYGTGDKFIYQECKRCGSLQIKEIPQDLSIYYPKNYYSFGPKANNVAPVVGFLRKAMRAHRACHHLGKSDMLGRLVSKIFSDYFDYPWRWFIASDIVPTSAILDVGCGGGKLLKALQGQGFSRLYGVDPFIRKTQIESGLEILKGNIFNLQLKFDLVMFHHSLEHVIDPERHLQKAADLCTAGGAVLVRIPVVDGFGWRQYREHWFALDAPRHLHIPSRTSLVAMAQRCGLELAEMFCDSEPVSFWGSEIYKMGLPAIRPDGLDTFSTDKPFSEQTLKEFQRRVVELNAADDGDLACFIFRKPN